MLKKIRNAFAALYFSLPVQLLIVQARFHKLMLIEWLFLYLSVAKAFGVSVGIPYLFLEPEYLGEVNFLSLFLLGACLGAFIAAYNIATYIQDAYQFHFLLVEKHPFLIFVLNNSLLPLGFVGLFTGQFISFQIYLQGGWEAGIALRLLGFFAGLGLVVLLSALYFFRTNKNLFNLRGEKIIPDELNSGRLILEKARTGLAHRHRVDVFMRWPWKWAKPDETLPPNFRGMVKLLNQHHGNALFLQLVFFIVVVGFGFLEQNAWFQFPAGGSILIFFSILLMLTSAFTFWFRKLGPLLLVALAAFYFFLDYNNVFRYRHQALGMNYDTAPAAYNADRLFDLTPWDTLSMDLADTRVMLDNWKEQYEKEYGKGKKPKLVLICTSGGGLRSAFFTFRCMQVMDSLCQGAVMRQTRLITGASGGMIGAAYYRELFFLKQQGQNLDLASLEFADRMGKDLLNRISFKMVTGLFYPAGRVTVGKRSYAADRGWSFDDQLITNLGVFANRKLSDYAAAERSGSIPSVILTPVVMDDGRKLIISSNPASWLCRTLYNNGKLGRGVTGLEFRRFFREQDADSLLYATALRMNASFPMITPYIQLPSQPPVRLIDAGVADNLGIQTAAKFIYLFHDWLDVNTSGVLLVQIRDSETRSVRAPKIRRRNLFSELFDPIGSTYSSFALSKDIGSEDYLTFAESWMPTRMKTVTLEYSRLDTLGLKASLSWHLTRKEREDLENSLLKEKNQEAFCEIQEWLGVH